MLTARVLFSGVGGSTEGMVRAGLDVRDAIDAWPIAVDAHRRWHPSIHAVVGRVEDACELLPEPVALVWASPSCRPWSTANRSGRRGRAHPEYYSLARLVAQAFDRWAATWLVIENVCGLLWSTEGKAEMAELAAAVRARPWLTWTVTVVRSCEHGVRQLRRRPIIVVGPALCPILAGGAMRAEVASSVRAARGGGIDSDGYAKRSVYASAAASVMRDPRSREVTYVESRSIEECAGLQQIPMRVLEGLTRTAQYRLVGNAVPPSLAEWVCRCVLDVHRRMDAGRGDRARGAG